MTRTSSPLPRTPSKATGPGATRPGATRPGATRHGATRPGATGSRTTGRRTAGLGVPVLLATLAIITATAIAFVVTATPPDRPMVRTTGEATVGGPFSMVDHNGVPVTEESFKGKVLVLYFGFTYCPDVCPTQLLALSDALERLGDKGSDVAPVFVSVDPERDTPEVLKDYVTNFHPSMVGLTGSVEQVAAMADAFYVTYYKVKNVDTAAEYLMDHTSIVYVMGRDGKYLTHFTHATPPKQMAETLKQFL